MAAGEGLTSAAVGGVWGGALPYQIRRLTSATRRLTRPLLCVGCDRVLDIEEAVTNESWYCQGCK